MTLCSYFVVNPIQARGPDPARPPAPSGTPATPPGGFFGRETVPAAALRFLTVVSLGTPSAPLLDGCGPHPPQPVAPVSTDVPPASRIGQSVRLSPARFPERPETPPSPPPSLGAQHTSCPSTFPARFPRNRLRGAICGEPPPSALRGAPPSPWPFNCFRAFAFARPLRPLHPVVFPLPATFLSAAGTAHGALPRRPRTDGPATSSGW